MLLEWIDSELSARGWPRRSLVDVVPGFTEKKISEVFSGRRKLSADEADAIRRLFGYRLPHDPVPRDQVDMEKLLSRVGDDQKRAVVLYLEALLESGQGSQKAS